MEDLPTILWLDREQREREREKERKREKKREKERERKKERERERERERDLQLIFAKYEIIFTVYNYHSVDKMLSYILC